MTAVNGRARPSMDDVAAAAGVSKAAVSKVIRGAYGVSPAMRQRVETAIAELGYRPRMAARVMRGSSYTLGVEIPQLGNDFYMQVTQGAADELDGSGYQLIIAPGLGHVRGADVLNSLVDRQVDGIIAISPDVPPERLEELGSQVPTVLLGRHDQSNSYDTVTNDDRGGSELVMAHLASLGHERIAHLSVRGNKAVPLDLLPHTIRRKYYERFMRRTGQKPMVVYCDPLEPAAYDAARAMLDATYQPTAVFAANDTLAIGVLRARADLGLTPAELAVVGYDNVDIAANPLLSLTTVDQFGALSGATAVRLLMQRILEGRSTPTHHMIAPQLRVRSS